LHDSPLQGAFDVGVTESLGPLNGGEQPDGIADGAVASAGGSSW
jgi:hypothetical protein